MEIRTSSIAGPPSQPSGEATAPAVELPPIENRPAEPVSLTNARVSLETIHGSQVVMYRISDPDTSKGYTVTELISRENTDESIDKSLIDQLLKDKLVADVKLIPIKKLGSLQKYRAVVKETRPPELNLELESPQFFHTKENLFMVRDDNERISAYVRRFFTTSGQPMTIDEVSAYVRATPNRRPGIVLLNPVWLPEIGRTYSARFMQPANETN